MRVCLGSLQVVKPINQVLSSMVDQESGHQIEHDNLNIDGNYTVEEFEVRILGPESSGGPWQTKGTIRMQSSENALTVRVVTLSVSSNQFYSTISDIVNFRANYIFGPRVYIIFSALVPKSSLAMRIL